MIKLFKLFTLLLTITIYTQTIQATTVTQSQKECLLLASNLIETDFVPTATQSDLDTMYEVDLDKINKLEYSKCGYVPNINATFTNVWILDISNLNLTDFNFIQYPNVVGILASNNNFTDIDESIKDLYWLDSLDLRNNSITASNIILELLDIYPIQLNIDNNPLTNEFYHQLDVLGIDLNYTPQITVYLDGTKQDISDNVISYIATSTDLILEVNYATVTTIKNATGTDLNYDGTSITLLPGDYTITASNDKYQSVIDVSINLPEVQEPEIPDTNKPEDGNEKEENTNKEDSENIEDENKEDEENIVIPILPSIPNREEIVEDIEMPENVVEEIEEKEEKEEIIEGIEEIEPIKEEPIIEELPNTSEGIISIKIVLGWLLLIVGVVLWFLPTKK